jgi:alpha-1,6-mannosyltransferase
MACGTPVVCTSAGAVAELVPPGAGVVVAPRDARALADGIVHLFELERERARTEARAAAGRYAWPRLLARMLERYAVLARRRAR